MSIQGVEVYFTRIADVLHLPGARFTVDDWYLAGALLYFMMATEETGLKQVSRLLAGQCVLHRPGPEKVRQFYWNPIEIAREESVDDLDDAIAQTRSTVRNCVHAWASCYESLILNTSGGLDSSILLACLQDAPTRPEVFCINYFTAHPYRDERRYARAVAARAGVALYEEEAATASAEIRPERYETRVPVPHLCWEAQPENGIAKELTVRHSIDAVFSGHLGDELFLRSAFAPVSADYLWGRHLRGSLSMILDDAVYNEILFWRALRAAVRYGLLRRPAHVRMSVDVSTCLLVPKHRREQVLIDPGYWHPLFKECVAMPPAKLFQAHALTLFQTIETSSFPVDSEPVAVNPLCSQPLLELSLRIPTYLLNSGGRDRAVARLAFESDLPELVALRRGKCAGEVEQRASIRANLSVLRETLLDGYLVQHGLLDHNRLEKALTGDVSSGTQSVMEVLDCLSTEVWARRWASSVPNLNS